MTDFERDEFWKALGRLYDNSVALQRDSEALRDVATAHDERILRLKVLVEWLAEKERNRETGSLSCRRRRLTRL